MAGGPDLSTSSIQALFQEMAGTAVKDRTPLLAELVSRASSPPAEQDRLRTCASPIRGRTASGRERKGLSRCGSTSCFRCQSLAGKQAATRAWSLLLAGMNGIPDRSLMSSVTINAEHRDLPRFKRAVRKFMRKHSLKWSGEYSVSLAGMLHVHVTILHPGMSGLTLRGLLQSEFGPYPVINVKRLPVTRKVGGTVETVSVEDAVRGWIQYAHVPFKNRDFIRHPELKTPEGLAQFVEWDSAVLGDRRCEGGFTLEQKASAARMRKRRTKKLRSGTGTSKVADEALEGLRKFKLSKTQKQAEISAEISSRKDAVEGSVQLGSVPIVPGIAVVVESSLNVGTVPPVVQHPGGTSECAAGHLGDRTQPLQDGTIRDGIDLVVGQPEPHRGAIAKVLLHDPPVHRGDPQ
jgi:hypothetical protein